MRHASLHLTYISVQTCSDVSRTKPFEGLNRRFDFDYKLIYILLGNQYLECNLVTDHGLMRLP